MRNKLYSTSYLVFAATLATGSAYAAPAQSNHTTLAQTGNGSVTVPPGVARGYGNYSDGTPCIGTPKDPTAFPDKTSNPCDGKPLAPEFIPGPWPWILWPPVNVTAPGGQTAPETKPEPDRRAGQLAYEDGTPCVGRPKDILRPVNKETNPCVPLDEAVSTVDEPRPAGEVVSHPARPKVTGKGVPTIRQRSDGSLYIEFSDKK